MKSSICLVAELPKILSEKHIQVAPSSYNAKHTGGSSSSINQLIQRDCSRNPQTLTFDKRDAIT